MMIITDIGHIGIKSGGKTVILNPSLLAMARLANPVEIFSVVHGGHYPSHRIDDPVLSQRVAVRCYGEMLCAAIAVIKACSEDDTERLTGSCIVRSNGKLHRVPGKMPDDDIITIARHLLLHGIIGNQKPDPDYESKDKGDWSSEFSPRDIVYQAVAHLRMPEKDAWLMTVTSFRAAMEARYPPDKKKSIPTAEKYDREMEWAERMMAADAQRHGLH